MKHKNICAGCVGRCPWDVSSGYYSKREAAGEVSCWNWNQFVDFSEPIIGEIAFRFNGNLYCYLAYPVTTQTTTVSLASSNIESHTKVMPVFLQVLPRWLCFISRPSQSPSLTPPSPMGPTRTRPHSPRPTLLFIPRTILPCWSCPASPGWSRSGSR